MDARDSQALPVVGMVGAGQLARMTHQAAIALGQSLRVLAADAGRPGRARVRRRPGRAPHRPAPRCAPSPAGCDAVTFDHEQVPPEHLRALVADGVAVHPGPDALLHAQDKLVMRQRLAELGHAACPRSRRSTTPPTSSGSARSTAGRWCSRPSAAATTGAGVWMLAGADPDLVAELLAAGTPLMVEEAVPMRRELAALVARSPFGQAAAWPVVETVQDRGAVRAGARARARTSTRTWPSRPSGSRCASPPSSA